LKPESGFVEAARLGKLKFIEKDVVLLGDPQIFTNSNVNDFKF
jgi:rhamnose transport system substrate-binding protein